MMENIQLVHVVAMSQNRAIGKDNQLLWHIPDDLQHFKRITQGGVIVMGRKTFESLPNLLPNRTHIVITRQPIDYEGAVTAHSLQDAILLAKAYAHAKRQNKIFIIGGGEIYHQSLEMADVLEITEVDTVIEGDAFYPDIDEKFIKTDETKTFYCDKSGFQFRFCTWQKVLT
ncbi:dihydrofolate reductase [Moraxella catarrhalis]|uniref:dihydrofolate reductase n=1 Tax=Moraxella catarrhalis TaxID=480 RepID=UPI00128E792E|nr:dihydrofolate reductase [Moraxella catarrhalis]MPX83493.1 dihydrofolate reductase [Moraxella catarrhalis]